MIDVSVIIPVYDIPQPMLEACVASLRAQTLASIEFIFVDDCSPRPENLLYLRSVAQEDERVRVIAQSRNGGVSAARNAGIGAARGRYVGFVDADDVVAPQMYERMLEVAESDQADVVVCSTRYGQADGSWVELCQGNWSVSASQRGRCAMFFNTGLGTCDKLISRGVIGDIRFLETSSHNEDYLFNWEVLSKVDRVRFMSEVLYSAVYREGSASRSKMSARKFVSTFNSLSGMASLADRLWDEGEKASAQYLGYKIMVIGPSVISLFAVDCDGFEQCKLRYRKFMREDFRGVVSRFPILLRLALRCYAPLKRHNGKSGFWHKAVRFMSLYGMYRSEGGNRRAAFRRIVKGC